MSIRNWVLAGALVGAMPAAALDIEELSDGELSQLRGKYVASGGVVYFGIAMNTTWINQSGQQYQSTLNLGLNRAGQLQAKLESTLSLYTSDGGQQRQPLAHDGSGVSQVIVLTGNGNKIGNDLTLATVGDVDASGDAVSSALSYSGAADGMETQLSINSEGVFVGIFSPESGYIMQGVGSSGFFQEANGMGNGLKLSNTANISVVMDAGPRFDAGQMLNQLDLLTGL